MRTVTRGVGGMRKQRSELVFGIDDIRDFFENFFFPCDLHVSHLYVK